MPPVIPRVHAELHLSETQVGLLIGLPLGGVCRGRRSRLPAYRARRHPQCGRHRHDYRGACRRRARRGSRRLDALRRGYGDGLRRRHHAARPADAGSRMAAQPGRARHHRLYQRHADGHAICDRPDYSLHAAAGRRLLAARSVGLGGAGAADRAGVFACSARETTNIPRSATKSARCGGPISRIRWSGCSV